MIPVDIFYQKLNSVCAVVVKRKAILIVVFLQINSSYSHLLQMDFLLLACQHFGCIGCLVGCLKIWPLSNSQQFSSSHLLRDSKHWNWRVNIFIKFFVNLLTKSSLIFRFFIFFLKKRFTLHEFVYWTTRRKATSLQSANAAEITGKYAAKSETSIWSKYEYGEFIWEKTTE